MRIYRSPKPDIDLPNLDLLSLLFDSDWSLAKENTVIHAEAANQANSITKSQARDLVGRIAHVLREQYGVGLAGPGRDVVLCTSSGSPLLPVFFYSVLAAGGVYSGASTAFTVGELENQIKDAGSKLLVCSPEYLDKTIEAARRCEIPPSNVLLLYSEHNQRRWTLTSALDHSDMLKAGNGRSLDSQHITDPETLKNTTACLLYSSGTTGLPKGVRLSHRNLVASTICTMQSASQYLSDHQRKHGHHFQFRTIAHLPMAHIAGIVNFSTQPFYMGGTAYWMPKYDFRLFVEYAQRHQITAQFSVPPVWLQIAKSPDVTNQFHSLEQASTGAAPMGPELVKEVSGKLGRGKVWMGQTWGTTETDGSITNSDWTDNDQTGSVGPLLPNVSLRVLDDEDNDVEPGQPGEMLVSGPIVGQGYHNNDAATQASFMDGFYRTGDIGMFRNGLVYLVDRKKELIKYKGLQVAPAELEALLTSHPEIADAAVVGVESVSQGTEVPRAYVVRKKGANVSAEDIKGFVKSNLASHKQLRGGVVFVSEIPKSASGKILRKELRAKAVGALNAKL